MTLTALVFPVVAGFSGLAMDGAHWYSQRRATQGIADASAVAGAYARLKQESTTVVTQTVLDEAIRNGYEDVAANTLTVIEVTAASTGAAVPLLDVRVARAVPLYFASLILDRASIPISARAVSGVRNLGPQCIIALNQTAARAVEFTGNTTADIGCGVASNSDSDEALYIGGSAVLKANPAQAFGDIAIEGSGVLDSQLPPLPFSPRAPDPFENIQMPPTTPCDVSGSGNQPFSVTGNGQLTDVNGDGFITVCGGVTFKNTVDLDPGIYVVKNGDLSTQGGTTVTGDGISILLTGDSPTDVGSVNLNNNTVMDLSAPTSGPYEGVLFYQDRDASNPDESKFNGGVDLELDGVIYMPRSLVEFSGGSSNPDNCLQIVADRVTFTGNSFIRNDPTVCADLGLVLGGTTQQQVVLLE